MKRRTFLITAGALTSAGLIEWGRADVAHADPALASEGAVVPTRTDLGLLAQTTSGIDLDGTLSDPNWGDPVLGETGTLYYLEPVVSALLLSHSTDYSLSGTRVDIGL